MINHMARKKRESLFTENVYVCPDWSAVTSGFDQLPKPALRRDAEGEAYQEGWIFRGHKSECYHLEPSIERDYPSLDWPEAEYKALKEFQSKARMHMDPAQLPQTEPEHKLSWLAIMQHYGAPTRLLDFTYSPYVALYFALRNRRVEQGTYAEVWGIDGVALRRQAERTGREADKKVRERHGRSVEGHRALFRGESGASATLDTARKSSDWRHGLTLRVESKVSSLQMAQQEDGFWDTLVGHALNPCGVCRTHFNQNGFVSMALPPVQNPRLSSQQGVFLFSGAETLHFEESLDLMMEGVDRGWYKRFRVPVSALREVEEQLFQINIHELSLFPDVEGLGGFVRQKIRLHW
jgi:hypothetical protein